VNFLIDSQLPPALAQWISAQDHKAIHVADLGMLADDDSKIWQRAQKENELRA
jgi:predicted nuclease of predicted toxin-antitoxin system